MNKRKRVEGKHDTTHIPTAGDKCKHCGQWFPNLSKVCPGMSDKDAIKFMEDNKTLMEDLALQERIDALQAKLARAEEVLEKIANQDRTRGYPTGPEWANLITELKRQ